MTNGVYGRVEIVDNYGERQSEAEGILADVTFAGGWIYQIEKAVSHEVPQEGDEVFIAFDPLEADRHRVTIWRYGQTLTQYWIADRHILRNCSEELGEMLEKSIWVLIPGPGFLERSEGIQWCEQLWDRETEATFQPYPLTDTEPTEDRGATIIALPSGKVPSSSVLSVCGWRRVNGLHVPLLFVEANCL